MKEFFSRETSIIITQVIVVLFAVFLLIDLAVIIIAKNTKRQITNKYFILHQKYGFLKSTVIKFMIASFIIWELQSSQPNSGALLAPILYFIFYSVRLMIDLIKNGDEKKAKK